MPKRHPGSSGTNGQNWLLIAIATLVCLQWIFLRIKGIHPSQSWAPILPGLAIFGAAFLLTWAAEAAEVDLPQSVSIGIIALIAVLPEYAVDMYFAWMAGKNPVYTSYATANMTGANRLLIGIGWPAVLLACWWRRGTRSIRLSIDNALEIVALLAATLYAFIPPLKGTLSLLDCVFYLSLFIVYSYLASQSEVKEPELEEGPARLIAELPKVQRRATVALVLLFAAGTIILSAEPFAEGLLAAGRHWGIEEFLLVQWLAPLASEAPEFIVAILFALRGRPEVGMRALISSKVNQWTLLIGMLPAVFSLSSGTPNAMHLDARQIEEIVLTSAQSLLALVVLLNLEFSFGEALGLLILFSAQIFFPQASVRYLFAGIYVLAAIGILIAQKYRRDQIAKLFTHALRARP